MPYKYLHQIESGYELLCPIFLDLIHDGLDNRVFVVTDAKNNKFVLRESKRSGKNASFEVDVLSALEKFCFSSPHIIKTKKDKYLLRIDNREIILFEYIQGSQIEKLESIHLKSDVIEQGVRKLGELHLLTNGMNVNAILTRTIFTECDRLLKLDVNLLKQFKNSDILINQVKHFYKEAQSRIGNKQELFGVIHNDFRIQNLIFSDKDCFVIDFDWACYGPLLKDVGLAVAEWSLYNKSKGPSKEAIERFIKAYNETAPKAVQYDKDLIFWICFACLSDACTFLADVIEGKYPEKNIIDVEQCYMYKKFAYFYQELK